MRNIVALILLCFVGCVMDGTAAPDAGTMLASDAGTGSSDLGAAQRIVVPQFQVGNAVLRQNAFYDRQLSINCYPRNTTTGLRCLPADLSLYVFADAACSMPAGFVPNCQTPRYGLVETSVNICTLGTFRVYQLRKLTQANYYTKNGATCIASALSGYDLYAADTEIDPTTFAEAVEVR